MLQTTVLREVCRVLSAKSDVLVVDTKNEVGGSGNTIHPCVGLSRRMMVPLGSLDGQYQVMMGAIQSHSPEVMVVDELRVGSDSEAQVARMCKQQNIRLIAGAAGNLRKVINETLDPCIPTSSISMLVGGLHPVFECVVEIQEHHKWLVVMNTVQAVSQIRRGQVFTAQQRKRDPNTGGIQLDMIRM